MQNVHIIHKKIQLMYWEIKKKNLDESTLKVNKNSL